MSTREKLEFVWLMSKHSKATLADCQRLMRFAATHQRICTDECNREITQREHAKKIRVQRKIVALCAPCEVKPIFSGDPRGCTVKLRVPDGTTNDWGNEGICIPV
jgi:hypothetical protein